MAFFILSLNISMVILFDQRHWKKVECLYRCFDDKGIFVFENLGWVEIWAVKKLNKYMDKKISFFFSSLSVFLAAVKMQQEKNFLSTPQLLFDLVNLWKDNSKKEEKLLADGEKFTKWIFRVRTPSITTCNMILLLLGQWDEKSLNRFSFLSHKHQRKWRRF